MTAILERINDFLWGIPTLLMIIGVGVYISFTTGFVQLRFFPRAVRSFLSRLTDRKRDSDDGISPFRALCTALAATVGTGNIAGVAGAIAIGGPGAVFWMWVCGILGMVTKFSEAVLAVRYRIKNDSGEWIGGPMYMIQQGMGSRWKWLAYLYCFFGVIAAFGVGNATQINTVVSGVNAVIRSFGGKQSTYMNLFIGVVLAVLLSSILLGGAKRIGKIAEGLVPFAAVIYLLLCVGVLVIHWEGLPGAFTSIFQGAFDPKAVTGGVLGCAFRALRTGAARGVFTNEAGMGTAAIAHSAAKVDHPVEQGLMGIMEVFIDTILICTMTALVILSSGTVIPYGTDPGVTLSMQAFSSTFGDWINIVITIALAAFAIATVIGWGLYGGRCAQYLFGDGVWKSFVLIQAVAVIVGSVLGTQTVWLLAESVNALMAIPNLIALAYLNPELVRLVKDYR